MCLVTDYRNGISTEIYCTPWPYCRETCRVNFEEATIVGMAPPFPLPRWRNKIEDVWDVRVYSSLAGWEYYCTQQGLKFKPSPKPCLRLLYGPPHD